jgi:hypothetical protein
MPASSTKAKTAVPPVANALFVTPEQAPPEPPPSKGTAAGTALAYDVNNPPKPTWLSAEWELVTPRLAQEYLDEMHPNRILSVVDKAIMEQNLKLAKWYPDISVAYFDAEGCAWDGMHRFEAVVETGLPAWVLIVRGVRPEAAEFIDAGRARTYKDWLKMTGTSRYAQRGALVRMLAGYEAKGIDAVRNPAQVAVSRPQMDAWLHAPGIEQSLKMADVMRLRPLAMNQSIAAFMVMVTGAGQDPTGFWHTVNDGFNLAKGSPAATLRDYIMRGCPCPSDVRADPKLLQLFAAVSSWNKHVKGEDYPYVRPVYAERANGDRYFAGRAVPDILPLGYDKQAELEKFAEVFAKLRSGSGQPGA